MDGRLYIINELKRVASEIAPRPIRKNEFLRISGIPNSQIRKHFVSWTAALDEAGIEYMPHEPRMLSEDELMDAIGELWKNEGRRPTHDAVNYRGRYSTKPYRDRWGTLSKAI